MDTKAKCLHLKILTWDVRGICSRCLLEFIDWRNCQSFWHFRPSFATCCPCTLLSGSTLPPHLPCGNKYTVHTYRVCIMCKGGGYGVLGLRQINTCRKVPFQVNILRRRHLALLLWVLSFYGLNVLCVVWRRVTYVKINMEQFTK